MNTKEEFLKLSKEKQEEEAVKMTNKYYKLAEYWRKITIMARQGKIQSGKAA